MGGGIILILLVISARLYRENKVYESRNQRLIIQNDSVLSVNIELRNLLIRGNVSQQKASFLTTKEKEKK